MLDFDPDRVRANVREAETEDLLDRVTVYRPGMEPEALQIIEDELHARGYTRVEIAAHGFLLSRFTLLLPDGTAQPCSFCHRPAVAQGWGWHRFWSVLPLFPRYFFYCDEHRPRRDAAGSPSAPH